MKPPTYEKGITVNSEIKHINRSKIIRLFCKNQTLSRKDLHDELGLSLPTISQNISELLEENLICKSGNVGNTGGRNAEAFSFNSTAKVSMGLDITRHHITMVLIDLLGNIIASTRIRLKYEKDSSYLALVGDLVSRFLAKNNINSEQLLGVGLGIPALTDINNTKVVYSGIMDMDGLTADDFSQYIHYPVKIFNDANAACFAELHEPNGCEKDGFYIMLSTNVGGAVFINGQLYAGDFFRSGEVGHLVIHEDGKPCYCGQKGCLDPYCSATILTENTNEDLKQFFTNLEYGDEAAIRLWNEYLDNLSLAIRNVHVLFDCPIIIGGYVGAYIEKYMGQLKERISRMIPFSQDASFIRPCRYKVEAIAAGTALYFSTKFLESL